MRLIVSLLSILLLAVQCGQEKPQQTIKDWTSTYRVDSGMPVFLALTAYKTTMVADGKDQTLIRATAIDSTGKEIIGLSYYPRSHGILDDLQKNLKILFS